MLARSFAFSTADVLLLLSLSHAAACSESSPARAVHAAGTGADVGAAGESAGRSGAAGRVTAGAAAGSAGTSGSRGAAAGYAGVSVSGSGGGGAAGSDTPTSHWTPALGSTWQYQLTETLDANVDADVFDIDLYNTTAADIAALQAKQRKVVCYFDTAYESYRPDSKRLEPYRGNEMEGWPGQYWLDTRAPAVLAVMIERIDLAQEKGCDAVEADDVDARSNDPGFPITASEQQRFISALADAAHGKGLAFGLKNDLEEVSALVAHADFSINEQCLQYDECDLLEPFISAGKPVFNVEYTDGDLAAKGATVCPAAKQLKLTSIVKQLDLGPQRYACP